MLNHSEKRKHRRYPSMAKASLSEGFTGEALLRDISITGCRVECTMHVDIQENSEYMLTIHPEGEAEIASFDLLVECKWIHSGSDSCDLGFFVKKSPGKRDFERYVDYLAWRHNT